MRDYIEKNQGRVKKNKHLPMKNQLRGNETDNG